MLGSRYSQHSFAQTPAVHAPRSVFDRSFAAKDTYYFDSLMPFFVDEILPGDTCNISMTMFSRLATQVVPLMDNMYIDFFWFFVPNRLVWDNWERFNGAQDDPSSSTSFTVPQMVAPAVTGFIANSVGDHFGLPTEVASISVNALPFRGLMKIWNDWFRDQNANNSLVIPTDDGPDGPADINQYVGLRNKRHDYFTSCLPWPQKGTAQNIPVTGLSSSVVSDGTSFTMTSATAANQTMRFVPATNALSGSGAAPAGVENAVWGNDTGLVVTPLLSGTINQLRQAMQIQSMLELDARGGTRYVEILLAHWNVVSPDFRLQRSEFLSSTTVSINSHPVPQTSQTSGSNYQANLASFGTASGSNIGFTKSFTEHGFVIGVLCARGEVSYQQGTNRMWSRSSRYDYFWPKLQDIGEQAVLKKEMKTVGTSADDEVFGYQERYAEYRYRQSEIRGEFRSNFATSLDAWHLAQDYAGTNVWGEDFLEQVTPIGRNVVSTSFATLKMDMYFKYTHARVMKTYSVPASLGRL